MADVAAAAPRTAPSADRIVFVGHATALIEVDGVRLLTDPLLRSRVAHLRRHAPPVDAAHTADPRAVLISHLHHDHADVASLKLLGLQTPLIVPPGAGGWLGGKGFRSVSELGVGASVEIAGVSVEAVAARHDGARVGGPHADSVGYVVRGRRSVYFAGDTELFDAMSALPGDLDAALLPVGGWGPTLGPGHMDPLDAARAAALIRPRVAIPVHWGTLLPIGALARHRAALADPARRFSEHVRELAPDVEVRILRPGEATELE